jgi:hypothetical protein
VHAARSELVRALHEIDEHSACARRQRTEAAGEGGWLMQAGSANLDYVHMLSW